MKGKGEPAQRGSREVRGPKKDEQTKKNKNLFEFRENER